MVTARLLWAAAHGSRGKQREVEGDEVACHVLEDGTWAWGGLVCSALEEVKQKTWRLDAPSLRPKMRSRREEGGGGRAGFRASPPPPWAPHFSSVSYWNTPSSLGRGRREEQVKDRTGDIGWHIRNLLELVSWAGTWQSSRELLVIQSFKICTTHTQKMGCVWGWGMFCTVPSCKTNRKTGPPVTVTTVNFSVN